MNTAVAEANSAYFRALATTRASLSNLAGLSVPIIIVLGSLNMGLLDASAFGGHGLMAVVFNVNLALVWVCALVTALSLVRRFSYRFQVFFSIVMTFIAGVLVYCLCLMALAISSFVQAERNDQSVLGFSIGGLVAALIVAAATVVHVRMLRHRLQVGHSEQRRIANYVAASRSNRVHIFWITFGFVSLVPIALIWGEYLARVLGAAGLIFFACVTPSLPVEFAYLAYLKSKDRDYWEPRPPGLSKEERRRVTRKVLLWVFGVVAALGAFWILAKVL